MRFHKYFFCAVIVTTRVMPVFAQTQKIAMLKNEAASARNQDEKLRAMFALCDENESLNTDTLFNYAIEAKKIAILNHNTGATRVAAYYEAYSYYRKSILDSVTDLIQANAPKLKQESPASSYIALFDL